MVKTAINLYSVRALDEPLLDTIDRVADAGYDGVQISGGLGAIEDAGAGAVADKLAETGLDPVPPHVGMDELEDDLDDVVAAYRDEIGCSGAVIPHVSDDHFASAQNVDTFAALVDEVADDLAAADWTCHYHNHDFEFEDLGDHTAFDRFIDETAAQIELDVGWALVGGDDPAALIRELDDQIDLVHMKDMHVEEREFAEIGAGDVDMQACADAARDVDAEWLIYEHDDPENPAESIQTGADFLADL
ncbi:MAG: sugar phosphate isomerase/epimerase family protein [Halobacteriaceae archaeon]